MEEYKVPQQGLEELAKLGCVIAQTLVDPDFRASLTGGHDGMVNCGNDATHRIYASEAVMWAGAGKRPSADACPLGPLFSPICAAVRDVEPPALAAGA